MLDQNGPNDHFGQNALIPNWISALARPRWTKMVHFGLKRSVEVHFGPFRSANCILAIPDFWMLRYCIASQAAWYRMESGRGPKMGKSGRKREMAHGPKIWKKWPKKSKIWEFGSFLYFSAVFGPFCPISGFSSIFYFSANVDCRLSTRFPFYPRPPDS